MKLRLSIILISFIIASILMSGGFALWEKKLTIKGTIEVIDPIQEDMITPQNIHFEIREDNISENKRNGGDKKNSELLNNKSLVDEDGTLSDSDISGTNKAESSTDEGVSKDKARDSDSLDNIANSGDISGDQ